MSLARGLGLPVIHVQADGVYEDDRRISRGLFDLDPESNMRFRSTAAWERSLTYILGRQWVMWDEVERHYWWTGAWQREMYRGGGCE